MTLAKLGMSGFGLGLVRVVLHFLQDRPRDLVAGGRCYQDTHRTGRTSLLIGRGSGHAAVDDLQILSAMMATIA